ncbi:urease accessory protein UreH domain-containing protein [Streptomyces sp. NBC_00503]|uniref:urease accessory protein UreH domain-containing protein n=1 Tax=Streptomyces sp. NBC_00503 TaxID=2903659 RepID=UPI002E82138A|nr:sulfite exporter TauE/SafE family protein [Streptomyces sp. NBC_00503]WUD84937.1 sulfite exporter TauE/SafE family protein [Streptomyces sp. NBC_00503]
MASTTALFVTGVSTGLFAGGASCAAVQGGLLAGAVGRRSAEWSKERWERSGLFAPVGAFLGAKLVSHTLLGAALGLLGAAIQPGPRTQAALMLLAGVLMLLFALDMFGVPAVRRFVPRPPASWGRRVRRSAKSTAVTTPAVLGFLTVLIPCGVTLSVELVAVTSGAPLAGAAVMAGFVLGTGPLFAVLGFFLRSAARLWQGRLTLVTAVVVLLVAVWTLGSGLRLGGWWPVAGPSAAAAASVGEGAPEGGAAKDVVVDADGSQTVTIQARTTSYSPAAVTVKAGVPTTLVVATQGTGGCVRSFVVPDLGVQKILPTTGKTAIDLGTRKPGTLSYSCGMGMYGGRITFETPGGTQ